MKNNNPGIIDSTEIDSKMLNASGLNFKYKTIICLGENSVVLLVNIRFYTVAFIHLTLVKVTLNFDMTDW